MVRARCIAGFVGVALLVACGGAPPATERDDAYRRMARHEAALERSLARATADDPASRSREIVEAAAAASAICDEAAVVLELDAEARCRAGRRRVCELDAARCAAESATRREP